MPRTGSVRRLLSRFGPRGLFGLIVLGVYIVGVVIGPLFITGGERAQSLVDRLLPPLSVRADGRFVLLGTDQLGRDLTLEIMLGGRVSLTVGLCTLLFAGIFGVVIGAVGAYRGGKLDSFVMRVADIQLAFPSIILAILIAATLGPSITNVIITLSISRWVAFARIARGQVLSLKQSEYVAAARLMGVPGWRILFIHILPGASMALLIVATMEFGLVILNEASLSFLGLGVPADGVSWGLTISQGRDYLGTAWWISTLPGIALAILMVGVGTLGDELRDRWDPHMRVGDTASQPAAV